MNTDHTSNANLVETITNLTREWASRADVILNPETLNNAAIKTAHSWQLDGFTQTNFLTGWECWNEATSCQHTATDADFGSMVAELIVKVAHRASA